MEHAMYLFLNGAGGLTHDVAIWKDYARNQTRTRNHAGEFEAAPAKYAGLRDAAEQLRRLSRQAKLSAQEAKLLCRALTIVESEASARGQTA
ncbi:hypothetical protein [Nisaea denitrificans]|uniref:hypothetical protein n=1 Tax=Nisaea denitrificans TaxID=390877 RepID=UPI00048D960F|nr:hypothetical protein [Nisaea denitrificans]